eukprot:tig00021432_g21252.t1
MEGRVELYGGVEESVEEMLEFRDVLDGAEDCRLAMRYSGSGRPSPVAANGARRGGVRGDLTAQAKLALYPLSSTSASPRKLENAVREPPPAPSQGPRAAAIL